MLSRSWRSGSDLSMRAWQPRRLRQRTLRRLDVIFEDDHNFLHPDGRVASCVSLALVAAQGRFNGGEIGQEEL
jgi:hypothetical protein